MPAAKKGGARPGAGRPAGSLTKKTRAIAEKIIDQGITPLEVMLNTMRGFWTEAHQGSVPNRALKMQAAAMAEKCAPYCHPKLSNAVVNATVRRNIADFSDAELAALAGSDSGEDGA